MLKPIDSCVSNVSASCHFIPSCSVGFASVQTPARSSALQPLIDYRRSHLFDVRLDGQVPDDYRLTEYLTSLQIWELRDYPVESVLLAHRHFDEIKRKQDLQTRILESSAITTGIRANSGPNLDKTWESTSWGMQYLELEQRQDAWGGGRFAEAW